MVVTHLDEINAGEQASVKTILQFLDRCVIQVGEVAHRGLESLLNLRVVLGMGDGFSLVQDKHDVDLKIRSRGLEYMTR